MGEFPNYSSTLLENATNGLGLGKNAKMSSKDESPVCRKSYRDGIKGCKHIVKIMKCFLNGMNANQHAWSSKVELLYTVK